MLAPAAIQGEDLIDRRLLPLQARGSLDAIRVAADQLEGQHQAVSGFMTGNRITSRIAG